MKIMKVDNTIILLFAEKLYEKMPEANNAGRAS